MISPPPEDRRPPLTPQLALRVAVLGTFALGMFAIIFFRLWFVQVLSGQKYLAEAKVNRVRAVAIPAPEARSSTTAATFSSPPNGRSRSRSSPTSSRLHSRFRSTPT